MQTDEGATLKSLLEEANGSRRVRTLDWAAIRHLIEGATDKHDGWCHWLNGGTVCNSYDYPARTTVAAVAQIDGKTYLGIGVGGARSSKGSPSIAWPEWRGLDQAKSGRRLEKLRAWVDHHIGTTVIEVAGEHSL